MNQAVALLGALVDVPDEEIKCNLEFMPRPDATSFDFKYPLDLLLEQPKNPRLYDDMEDKRKYNWVVDELTRLLPKDYLDSNHLIIEGLHKQALPE